ncbi:hypothetical protein AYI70_g8755 [Smittium culicis]|uniref:Uncharacterized protein n=1 Tax=Smittium culicis TaxID=133412 RepID=A0A1R1XEI1_9FUNG|nr:hypothetical protein AYI70_g8755 [Smittium culicis]
MSQDQVKELADMVKELLRDKECNAEPEDPYVTTRIPLTDLAVYPELIEALPSIEEDFFCTPLTEEERKEAIHSCPRSSSLKYQPPPLNDSASAAENPQITYDDPLMDKEKPDALILSKKPEKRSRIRMKEPISSGCSHLDFPSAPNIHKSSSTDIGMGENKWDTKLRIFGRSPYPRRDEGSLRRKHSQSLFQACETRLQDQAREIEYETMSVDNSPMNGHQFSEYDAQSSFIQGPGPKKGSSKAIECGTEEQLSIENEIMDVNCHIDRTSDSELVFLGSQAEVMERAIVPARDPRV